MKLRISSDGTVHGTHVYARAPDGEFIEISHVQKIVWRADASDQRLVTATIEVTGVEFQALVDHGITITPAGETYTKLTPAEQRAVDLVRQKDDIPF